MRDTNQMFMFYGALLSNPSVMPQGILTQTKESQQDTINRLNQLAEMAYDKMNESIPLFDDHDSFYDDNGGPLHKDDIDNEDDLNQIYDSRLGDYPRLINPFLNTIRTEKE